jgi:hypothetical protein
MAYAPQFSIPPNLLSEVEKVGGNKTGRYVLKM